MNRTPELERGDHEPWESLRSDGSAHGPRASVCRTVLSCETSCRSGHRTHPPLPRLPSTAAGGGRLRARPCPCSPSETRGQGSGFSASSALAQLPARLTHRLRLQVPRWKVIMAAPGPRAPAQHRNRGPRRPSARSGHEGRASCDQGRRGRALSRCRHGAGDSSRHLAAEPVSCSARGRLHHPRSPASRSSYLHYVWQKARPPFLLALSLPLASRPPLLRGEAAQKALRLDALSRARERGCGTVPSEASLGDLQLPPRPTLRRTPAADAA